MVEVQPARILLVENEPLNTELLQLALNSYNFVNLIDVVEDGEQALHYLLGQAGNPPIHPLPDIVILDLRLPKVSGLQVLQAIRNHPRTQDLPVIILTASEADSDLDACNTLGITSYFVKPFNFEKLIIVVRQVGFYWMLLKSSPQPSPSS